MTAAVATVAAGGGIMTDRPGRRARTLFGALDDLHLLHPYRLKERMSSETKAMRSAYIRLDVEIAAIFEAYGGWRATPDRSKLDEVLRFRAATGCPSSAGRA